MVHVPIPVPRLCLQMEFDIDMNAAPLSSDRHDAAVKEAARAVDKFISFSQFGVTPEDFSGRAVLGSAINPNQPLTLATAHAIPFDPTFHVAATSGGGAAIRYEFIYNDIHPIHSKTTSSKLFLRIVTSFGKPNETIDGVLGKYKQFSDCTSHILNNLN
jgi:hypothetical protein